MDDSIYDQLIDALNRRGGTFPAIKSQVLRDIIETIFSDEDALIAIKMPELPVTADEMAMRVERDLEEVKKTLEIMAKKGILFITQIGEKRIYILSALIPGILENQLMKGATDDRAKKMARLVTQYLASLQELEKTES